MRNSQEELMKIIDMDMSDDEFVDFLVSLPPNADGELTEKMYQEFEKAKAKGPIYDKSFAEFLKRYVVKNEVKDENGEND